MDIFLILSKKIINLDFGLPFFVICDIINKNDKRFSNVGRRLRIYFCGDTADDLRVT